MKLSTYQDIIRDQERLKILEDCMAEVEKVSCGEDQIECDGAYDDSDGMKWIYDRIQEAKKSLDKIF